MNFSGTAYRATTADALELHVGGSLELLGETFDGPDIDYDATPPDLLSAAGVAAPSFTGFPLT